MTEHEPLPVKGYKPQDQKSIDIVNEHKVWEEKIRRRTEDLEASVDPQCDPRLLRIAWTHFELGFLALNKAVFRPDRVELEDGDELEF